MPTKLFTILMCLVISLAMTPAALDACSGAGPADPVTGLISYPPGQGNGVATTSVATANLTGTPFEGGKYFKGWVDNAMKLIVVPASTTLVFEGIIEGVAGGSRPPAWEEGEVRNMGGTTIAAAPLPTWTISGNGRGDYRDGNFPPSATGLKYTNFESPPSAIIAPDSPNEKAFWYLTYDRDTALRVLVSVWNDPLARAAFMDETSVPADLDVNAIAEAAKEPMADDGAKSLSEFEIKPSDDIKDSLDSRLTQRTGQILQTGSIVTRKFLDADGVEFTKDIAEEARVIIKAGYVAMQGATVIDFYPTGRYNTKYFITPPSSPQYEVSNAKLDLNFTTPTAPDYWVIDLQSGLESARDCVWCWVEADMELVGETEKILDQSDIKNFYKQKAGSYSVGGVFVRGLYSSGTSSAGRNTMIHVVVADTESPAQYRWVSSAKTESPSRWETADVTGKTGQTLAATGGSVNFRVFDNNPVIGSNDKHNNIFDVYPGLNDFDYVEASKRPDNQESNTDIFVRYLEPVKDGFNDKNLLPTLHYNVCVPAFAGFKIPGEGRNYNGPIPAVNDSIVLPLQKFVWKTAEPTKPDVSRISSRKIYDADGNEVSDLASLHDEPNWKGYSSYLVTVDSEDFAEPMGSGLAENSLDTTLSIAGDFKASAPTKKMLDVGIPVDENKVHYFGWNKQALKMFVSASDGLTVRNPDGSVDVTKSNRSPSFTGANSIQKIFSNKFSGAEIEYPAASVDFVSIVEEPATVDALAAKLKATEIVKGGSLGGCALPALEVGNPPPPIGAWGKFNYVSQLADTGKPNIALEVLNSKNEKAVIFGNLYAMGESSWIASAASGAGTDEFAFAADSNIGDKSYSSASKYYDDDAWEFKDDIDKDVYLPMKNSMDIGTFKPWLFAFGKPEKEIFWKTGYWNGEPATDANGIIFYDKKLAFQQGSRDRLVFRYWVYDNINPFDTTGANPNGVIADSSAARSRFKSVSGFVNAEVKLTDKPGYQGNVDLDKVWWPDYIFHNPSNGSAEECSISLKTEDEKNNIRNLKLWFRIIAPSREIIRTIEDRRNREN